MEILVCVKRVPDTAENEIEVAAGGSDIERDDLVYSVNEWDNYAVEEAIQLVDKAGGSVTVVSVGDEEAEEVVRREMPWAPTTGFCCPTTPLKAPTARALPPCSKQRWTRATMT